MLSFTELTLAALLFADATTVPLRVLKGDAGVPGRLLSVGLLLTLVLGAVVAMLVVPGVSWAEAALIAAVLAPTDAALGMAVVTDKAVPVRIRRALNIESGLNDGIATPFVTVFLAVVVGETTGQGGSPVLDALAQIAIAIGVAVVVGVVGWQAARVGDAAGVVVAHVQAALRPCARLRRLHRLRRARRQRVRERVRRGPRLRRGGRRQPGSDHASPKTSRCSPRSWSGSSSAPTSRAPCSPGGSMRQRSSTRVLSLTLIRMVPVAVALLGKGFRPLTDGLHGVVRPARARVGRVHPDRRRGTARAPPSTRRCSRSPPGRSSCPSSSTGSPPARSPPPTAPGSAREPTTCRSSSTCPSPAYGVTCSGRPSYRRADMDARQA